MKTKTIPAEKIPSLIKRKCLRLSDTIVTGTVTLGRLNTLQLQRVTLIGELRITEPIHRVELQFCRLQGAVAGVLDCRVLIARKSSYSYFHSLGESTKQCLLACSAVAEFFSKIE